MPSGGGRYSDSRYSDNRYSDISKWAMQWVRVMVRVRVKVRVKVTVRVTVSVSCAFSEAFVGIAAFTRCLRRLVLSASQMCECQLII